MKKPQTIKFIRTVITIIIWLYVSFIAIISLPPVEHELANMVESALSDHLDTEVQIKRIKLGWMNSITIDDMIINDRYGNEMFEIARASATFNFKDAINGKISIESAQLFGIKASLYNSSFDAISLFKVIEKHLESSSFASLKLYSFLNISSYNFLDSEPLDILNEITTVSLLGEQRMVIITEPEFLKQTYKHNHIVDKFTNYFLDDYHEFEFLYHFHKP